MPAKPLANDITSILSLMQEIGGAFTKTLTQLYFVADRRQRQKLLEAFDEEFDKYDSMVTMRKETSRESPYATNLHRRS